MIEFTSVAELAEQARQSVRLLNHATHPGSDAPGLKYPSDLYAIFGSLASMSHMLPQLLEQSGVWLERNVETVEVHGGSHSGDPVGAVAVIQVLLVDAKTAVQVLGERFDEVQNALARLASTRD